MSFSISGLFKILGNEINNLEEENKNLREIIFRCTNLSEEGNYTFSTSGGELELIYPSGKIGSCEFASQGLGEKNE